MEPVFMILGQSAATAASLAINGKLDVQAVDYAKLRERLLADKQVLEYAAPPRPGAIDAKKLPGMVVDDDAAERKGFEAVSTSLTPYVGTGYRHDGNADRGKQTIRFVPDIPDAGLYEVRLSYTANPNRATNVPVTITNAGRTSVVTVNQRKPAPLDGAWLSLGKYWFEKGKDGFVEIGNAGADGHVIADAVQWLRVKK
jgi:hypothetical protein